MPLVLVSHRPRQFINVPGTGDGAAAVADHVAAGDPHTAYATDVDLSGHVSAADPHATIYTKNATEQRLIDSFGYHLGLTDPHSQYAFDSDLAAHAAAVDPHSGYATDVDLVAHANASDPHPGYLTPSEGDAAYAGLAHGHPKILGPYLGSGGVALATGAAGRTAMSCVVPDPGFAWIPVAFGYLEARVSAAGTRAGVGIYVGSYAAGNRIAWGSGFDPVNQGAGGNGYWGMSASPRYSYSAMASPIAAGASAAARTILLCPVQDYGGGTIDSTTFGIGLCVFAVPA